MNSYVLITPARNEERYIEQTIQSVIRQSVLPTKWVIVSDGSTDFTDEIVTRYLSQYSFITLLRIPSDAVRSFASKARAFRAGLVEVSGISYDFIGNLDADVCIDPDYCEKVLRMFEENEKLGIAGGVIHDCYGGKFQKVFISPWCVGGAIQLFRRECYDHIGGYIPSRYGGVDLIAEIMARQKGWEVRVFPDLKVYHLRRTGTEKGHILYARFRQGLMESSLCYHPLFEFVKALYRISERPYFIGSLFRLFGYFWGSVSEIDKVLVRHEGAWKMRDRPLGAGLQELASNRLKLQW